MDSAEPSASPATGLDGGVVAGCGVALAGQGRGGRCEGRSSWGFEKPIGSQDLLGELIVPEQES